MLEISHLTKIYGDHLALSDLTCTIEAGKIYGFLGPNGAGKSTTMNIITGCLSATSGTATIDGYDIFDEPEEAKKRIGYLPELPPLYMDMTPTEYLEFVARAKGVAKSEIPGQIRRVMEFTRLEPMKKRLCRNLSKGYKQRVGVAQALLGAPKLIILDEPTVGLDPKQIIEIRDLIRDLGHEHTVLLSSHILPEVQSVCDHILIISHGKLVASDTPENLETLFSSVHGVNLTVLGEENALRQALADLAPQEKILVRNGENGQLKVVVSHDEEHDIREALFRACAKGDLPILEMTQTQASLEDVFLELTQEAQKSKAPVESAQAVQEKEAE